MSSVQSDHRGPVRITKDYLCAHVNQLINKEQPAFEHFLVNKHASPGLSSSYQYDTQQVRRKSRPYRISNGENGTINKGIDLIILLCRHVNIVPTTLQLYSQPLEGCRNDPQLIIGYIFYSDL